MQELLRVTPEEWLQKIPAFRDHYAQFGNKLPPELAKQLDELEARLKQGN